MTQRELTQLGKIYNTLTLVSTKGDDTITMAECLKALKALYEHMSENVQEEKEDTSTEE